jgi:threonine dehydrogenase-like Zn-dependent dehydrogenase
VGRLGAGRELSRRGFLKRAGATSLAGLAFPTIVFASVRGGAGGVAPGDKIAVALVGAGPQGQEVTKRFLVEEDARVVAACDVKSDQLQMARELVDGHYRDAACAVYADFREVLARPDVDAVIVATPTTGTC